MDRVEVLVAHSERATLRVGNVFVKIDADQTRADLEVEAMGRAPVPTAEILWRQPPALALAALPGGALGHLGEPSLASSQAWVAAGAAVRTLRDAPLPPWPGRSVDELAARLDAECEWLLANDVLPADAVTSHRRRAEVACVLSRAAETSPELACFLMLPAATGRSVRVRCAIASRSGVASRRRLTESPVQPVM